MKKTNIFLKIAGIIMLIVALSEGISGIKLLQSGKTIQSDRPIVAEVNEIIIAGVGLILVATLFIISGIGIIFGKKQFVNFSIITISLFVIVGIINGKILYDEPLDVGTTINITLATLLLVLLYLGRKSSSVNQE